MSLVVQEDSADIFDDSLSNLFSIPPIAFSTPNSTSYHTYTPPTTSPNRTPIQLRIPQPPASLHRTLQANHLWLAAVYLSDLICTHQLQVQGLRIAELGAGAGLPGLCACREGGEVVSSDWGVEEVISVIEDNFARTCERRKGDWAVRGHKWGEDPLPMLTALRNGVEVQFDALLLADTLWVTDAHSVLLDSMLSLLRVGGVAHVAAGLHTGRGPLDRFLHAAEGRGFKVERVGEVRWKLGGGWKDNEDVKQGLEEERGVVVYYKLHR